MGGSDREKLLVRFCGGLEEKNYECGVVSALRVREATSFSLEKKNSIYLTQMLGGGGISELL